MSLQVEVSQQVNPLTYVIIFCFPIFWVIIRGIYGQPDKLKPPVNNTFRPADSPMFSGIYKWCAHHVESTFDGTDQKSCHLSSLTL
jgi:hypothetical protein